MCFSWSVCGNFNLEVIKDKFDKNKFWRPFYFSYGDYPRYLEDEYNSSFVLDILF